jgi:predicted RNA-binding Zn-ribbon protein involved in translation (DUF1610 family)
MYDKTNIPVCGECGFELEIVFVAEKDDYGVKTGYKIVDYMGCPNCLTNIIVDDDYLRHK